jgi:sugar phosphate isomerase/epimerase
MDRLSVCETTTYRWTFEQDVQNYLAAGIRQMGVWRQKLSDYGEDKGAELLRECGLRVSSLSWAGGFTGSDGRTHRESVDDASDAIRVAAMLDAECLVVYTGGRANHTHNHARRIVGNALKELLPLAKKSGVTLALEPMHPGCAADWTFLTSVEHVLALIREIGSPHLKFVFDCYHLGQSHEALNAIGDFVEHVALVQLGDARQPPRGEQSRCRLGEGRIPVGEIVAEFERMGYTGSYEIELHGEEFEAADYEELVRHSTQTFGDLRGASAARE